MDTSNYEVIVLNFWPIILFPMGRNFKAKATNHPWKKLSLSFNFFHSRIRGPANVAPTLIPPSDIQSNTDLMQTLIQCAIKIKLKWLRKKSLHNKINAAKYTNMWKLHTEALEMVVLAHQTEAVQTPSYHQGHLLIGRQWNKEERLSMRKENPNCDLHDIPIVFYANTTRWTM